MDTVHTVERVAIVHVHHQMKRCQPHLMTIGHNHHKSSATQQMFILINCNNNKS
jgi:hypothetical protein